MRIGSVFCCCCGVDCMCPAPTPNVSHVNQSVTRPASTTSSRHPMTHGTPTPTPPTASTGCCYYKNRFAGFRHTVTPAHRKSLRKSEEACEGIINRTISLSNCPGSGAGGEGVVCNVGAAGRIGGVPCGLDAVTVVVTQLMMVGSVMVQEL